MAFNINMNRLNLPNMVDRQLKDTVVPTETYFNPLIIMGKRKSLELKPKKVPANKTNISTSLNSIMATVHNKLKTFKTRKADQPALTATVEEPYSNAMDKVADTPTTETPTLETPKPATVKGERSKPSIVKFEKPEAAMSDTTKSETKKLEAAKPEAQTKKTTPELQSKMKTTTYNQKSTFHYNLHQLRMPSKAKSISQIKAAREIKSHQRLRRNVPQFEDINGLATQKRIYEVKKQKRILEDMLQQHQKLQRDRHSIALEIQAMREHLSDIRNKLDLSLRKLSTSHTMSERPVRSKRAQSAASGRLASSPARNRQRPISVDRRVIKGT